MLRDDGTLWVEIGDSYARHGGTRKSTARRTRAGHVTGSDWDGSEQHGSGQKPKDLLGQPWLLAFALRADGWYLRSEIIWARPNPMPESVTDRPTKAHSTVFLLSKSPRYFYDQEAIRETLAVTNAQRTTRLLRHARTRPTGWRPSRPDALTRARTAERRALGANARSVWTDPHRANPLRPLRNLAAEAREPDDPGGNVRARGVPGVRGAVGAGGGANADGVTDASRRHDGTST